MRPAAYLGVGLGLAGALVDFYSAYTLAPMGEIMMGYAAGVFVLVVMGAVVLAVGMIPFFSAMSGTARQGAAMEILGVAMIVLSYLLPGMVMVAALGMEIVGALMILNGIVMQRPSKART